MTEPPAPDRALDHRHAPLTIRVLVAAAWVPTTVAVAALVVLATTALGEPGRSGGDVHQGPFVVLVVASATGAALPVVTRWCTRRTSDRRRGQDCAVCTPRLGAQ